MYISNYVLQLTSGILSIQFYALPIPIIYSLALWATYRHSNPPRSDCNV